MPKLKTSMRNSPRRWWIWGMFGVVTVVAGALVFYAVISNDDKQEARTVGSMISDQQHPFEDHAAAAQSFDATPGPESSVTIYTSRLAELATLLGLSNEHLNYENWPEIVLTIDNENRAAMRIVLESILNEAVHRGDISYVDRDRVLYTFDLGLIDAPLSAIAEQTAAENSGEAAPQGTQEPEQPANAGVNGVNGTNSAKPDSSA